MTLDRTYPILQNDGQLYVCVCVRARVGVCLCVFSGIQLQSKNFTTN